MYNNTGEILLLDSGYQYNINDYTIMDNMLRSSK